MSKIKLTQFNEFEKVVEDFSQLREGIGIYKELGKSGSSINLNELIYTSRGIYYVLPDKTLKKVILYKGERHFNLKDKANDIPEPNFHLYKCDFVKKQLEQKSKGFKITTRKDGTFLIKDFKFDQKMKRIEEESSKKLIICNSCFLTNSSIKRINIPKEDFNIKEYLEPGYSSLTFTYNFDEIPVGYKNNWKEIAFFLKQKHKYTCEKCKTKIEKIYAEKFLNIHFTTERIYTKYTDHVQVLCIKCHSDEPGHEHLKKKTEYLNYLESKSL